MELSKNIINSTKITLLSPTDPSGTSRGPPLPETLPEVWHHPSQNKTFLLHAYTPKNVLNSTKTTLLSSTDPSGTSEGPMFLTPFLRSDNNVYKTKHSFYNNLGLKMYTTPPKLFSCPPQIHQEPQEDPMFLTHFLKSDNNVYKTKHSYYNSTKTTLLSSTDPLGTSGGPHVN